MIARGTGYVKGAQKASSGRLKAHLKYIQHRELGPEETRESRQIFGKDEEGVSRPDAMADIMDHKTNAVHYHKIVLSPDQASEPVYDWQQWTRETMADLEKKKGLELHWYAVHHSNTDDEHVHVVLAGGGENERGEIKAVKLDREDYQFMRESGHEHSEHAFYQRMQEQMKEAQREEEFNRELYKPRAQEPEREPEPTREPEEQIPVRPPPRQEPEREQARPSEKKEPAKEPEVKQKQEPERKDNRDYDYDR